MGIDFQWERQWARVEERLGSAAEWVAVPGVAVLAMITRNRRVR